MSATVETVQLYLGICWECKAESSLYDEEVNAEDWAAEHDAEFHETDNSTDEAYERFKEARYGD